MAIAKPATTIRLIDSPAEIEHQHARHQRDRDREGRDQRRAPLEEERAEGGDEQDRADHRRQGQVVDRLVDVRRRPRDRRVDRDPGKARPQLVERLLDAARDLEGVGVRELLDHDQAVLAPGEDRVADQRLVVLHHVCDVAQAQRRGAVDGHLREVTGGDDREDVAHLEPLLRRVDPAARAGSRRLEERQRRHPHGVAGRLDDLVQR